MNAKQQQAQIRSCGLCGKNPPSGIASVWSQVTGTINLCHPNDPAEQDCYHLWTVYAVRPDDWDSQLKAHHEKYNSIGRPK